MLYSVPDAVAFTTPAVSVERTGEEVNVCVPAQVLEVEVPNARLKLFAEYWIGYVAESEPGAR